jgi:hypothetical protein
MTGASSLSAAPAGITPLDLTAFTSPVAAQRAFILQHPDGDPKRLAFVRNRISPVADGCVYYLTDTKEDPSGSPVFDCAATSSRSTVLAAPAKAHRARSVKKNVAVRLDVIAAAGASVR